MESPTQATVTLFACLRAAPAGRPLTLDGMTAIVHVAVTTGVLSSITLVLAAGADRWRVDASGKPPNTIIEDAARADGNQAPAFLLRLVSALSGSHPRLPALGLQLEPRRACAHAL
ncbi:uncharacterized protein AMSG_07092 [Thecamonas trahens ATCC 50062]|uniref:Uncharacterized protein n=1 Tax=Thecamonas trahens ATCC 50062 TaxID=461836 RepID=A0A0L0DFM9_THETB|nr:hypothetical protein AMSG_07092 [Thecamonas trahens ATCC 50062]KNC51099.1 hypothetical protein AMSG_07092 [Thecamonas trahens ATCC 50062]|eukprot:XP_013756550.1 hypothetical protein AMSG_07092 [Thecamonas trahens ATCC 50062]